MKRKTRCKINLFLIKFKKPREQKYSASKVSAKAFNSHNSSFYWLTTKKNLSHAIHRS